MNTATSGVSEFGEEEEEFREKKKQKGRVNNKKLRKEGFGTLGDTTPN
jgi:hypothetical protein